MDRAKGKGYVEPRSNKVRVNSSLEPALYEKLDKLACACGVTPTTLMNFFADVCLNNENIVNFTQDQHKHRSRFRIIPSKVDGGEMQYIFVERKAAK